MRKPPFALLALAAVLGTALTEGSEQDLLLSQLQFSPDGKYVLAQDDSQITVLTVDPLAVVYRVQADGQVLGHFTPDSGELVFVTSMTQVVNGGIQGPRTTLRVERFSLMHRARVASTAIPGLIGGTASLAPDGRTLACNDMKGTLRLVDVRAAHEVFAKKKFALPWGENAPLTPSNLWAADFQFSPDGRFLVALPEDEGAAVLWDSGRANLIKSQGEIKLLSKLAFRADSFAFMASDRLAVVRSRWLSWKEGSKCAADTLAFPSGGVVSIVALPRCPGGPSFETGRAPRPFRRATDPNFLIIDYEVVIARDSALSIGVDMSPIPVVLLGRKARINNQCL